jgi:radical SAM superfamily enzyme YgiQ (UPF0313 family)
MRYEGNIYRPPSEARSYLLQVTVGCSHNGCTFCGMFKDKKFHLRDMKDVMTDLDLARQVYRHIDKIFLCDGDALCLAMNKLMPILERIRHDFPEVKRVGIYGSPRDVLRKTPQELETLREAGIGIIYIGAESGSDKVLKHVNKGATRAQIIEAVQKVEAAGIPASVTFINGLGGKELWEEHAVETGTMISEMGASYVAFLTLLLEDGGTLADEVKAGTFHLLSAEEILAETLLVLKHTDVKKHCMLRSNHASNYVALRGNLPEDKDRMMEQLRTAMANTSLIKDERFRML